MIWYFYLGALQKEVNQITRKKNASSQTSVSSSSKFIQHSQLGVVLHVFLAELLSPVGLGTTCTVTNAPF